MPAVSEASITVTPIETLGRDPKPVKIQNKKLLSKGDEAVNARLVERLRQNEDIRHKGQEAKVKRDLAKLKNNLRAGELAKGEKVIAARKAQEAKKAADVARKARDAKKATEVARAAKTGRQVADGVRAGAIINDLAPALDKSKQRLKYFRGEHYERSLSIQYTLDGVYSKAVEFVEPLDLLHNRLQNSSRTC